MDKERSKSKKRICMSRFSDVGRVGCLVVSMVAWSLFLLLFQRRPRKGETFHTAFASHPVVKVEELTSCVAVLCLNRPRAQVFIFSSHKLKNSPVQSKKKEV